MTRRLLVSLSLVAAGLSFAASAGRADDALTQAAEREKARRAEQADRQAKPGKTYTDEDLKALNKDAKQGQAQASAPRADAPAATEPSGDETQGDDGTQGFRQAVAAQRQEVAAQRARVNEIEARITELRQERTRPTRLTEVNRDQSISADIVAATADLEEARKDLAKAEERVEEIIEEARRAGVPYSQLE